MFSVGATLPVVVAVTRTVASPMSSGTSATATPLASTTAVVTWTARSSSSSTTTAPDDGEPTS